MAESLATRVSRGHRPLCLPIAEEFYRGIVGSPGEFRRTIDDWFRPSPELFPANFARGSPLKDDRRSAKQGLLIRRIVMRDGAASSVRPSFLMPSLTARAGDVEGPLFWRKFGVPFWALARVFGNDPISWYRLECGLGRFSVVGATVRRAEIPEPLPADEQHQTLDGEKGTRAAWKALFRRVVILECFLHAWLKIRDRGKPLKEQFAEVSRRVWEAYHAPDRRGFGPRLRSLRGWAAGQLTGVVLEQVLDLCEKRKRWSVADRHPGGRRTSNRLDRLMRGMNRDFDPGQHLHGSREACRLHCRAWALLGNFAPWHPATARQNQGWRCPAERLNRHRHHECWLQNLLSSASLGGCRRPRPQNP